MTKAMRKAASEAITKCATARAADLAPTITELQAAGATSLRAIAAGLNERGIPTARGTGTLVGDTGYAGAGTALKSSDLFRELAAGRLSLALRRLVCRHTLRPIFVRLRLLIFLIAFLSLRHGDPLGKKRERLYWRFVEAAPLPGQSRAKWRE